jgi:hypothetical protein
MDVPVPKELLARFEASLPAICELTTHAVFQPVSRDILTTIEALRASELDNIQNQHQREVQAQKALLS